jgi:hypothetical protein
MRRVTSSYAQPSHSSRRVAQHKSTHLRQGLAATNVSRRSDARPDSPAGDKGRSWGGDRHFCRDRRTLPAHFSPLSCTAWRDAGHVRPERCRSGAGRCSHDPVCPEAHHQCGTRCGRIEASGWANAVQQTAVEDEHAPRGRGAEESLHVHPGIVCSSSGRSGLVDGEVCEEGGPTRAFQKDDAGGERMRQSVIGSCTSHSQFIKVEMELMSSTAPAATVSPPFSTCGG